MLDKAREKVHFWVEKDKLINSKFFNAKVSIKRRKKRLITSENDAREWIEGNQLDSLIVDYFQSIFSTNVDKGPMDFLLTVWRRVTDSMNEDLIWDFTVEEIHIALKQMHPTKALGLDGMALIFY